MPRFGVDQNFPEPLLEAARPFLAEWYGVEMIKYISEDLIRDKEDWQVMLALHQLGWDGLIGLDAKILSLPREMAVVEQTRFTLVAIESAADDPLRAIGQFLVYARRIGKEFDPARAQVFRIGRPQAFQEMSPWDCFTKISRGKNPRDVFREHRLTDDELAAPVLGDN
jgi:hypothetical protein